MDEWDIVQAIFLEKIHCKEALRDAIGYESEGLWKNARDNYLNLLQTDLSLETKDFYYESYFKCFANLGEWKEIPDAIVSVVGDGNSAWTSLWDGGWAQQKLLPWYITAQVRNGLYQPDWPQEFFANINACLSDDNTGEYLKSNFSEELCMMALCQTDIPLATIYLKSYIKYFLEEWQLINPMLQSLRYQKLLKLHGFIEISEFISIYDSLAEEFETSIPKIVNKWENLSKEILPSVMMNETRHLYRSQFIQILIDRLSAFAEITNNHHEKNLKKCKIKMDINLINIAAERNNFYVARKYYRPYELKSNIKLRVAFGNIGFARSKIMNSPENELKAILEAQEIFSKLVIFIYE